MVFAVLMMISASISFESYTDENGVGTDDVKMTKALLFGAAVLSFVAQTVGVCAMTAYKTETEESSTDPTRPNIRPSPGPQT